MTDIEIARNAKIKKINEIAKENGISEEYLENYGKFKAKISLEANGKTVDGKSLMNIIAACIKCGSEVLVSCDGEDENEMLEKAVSLIESGLGE